MALDPAQLKERLRGLICYPVTPFDDQLAVDLAGLRRHVTFLVEQGVHVLNVCGGTGEVYSLTLDEYEQVVGTVVDVVGGRIPVIAGVGYNVGLAREMARIAEAAGADGLLVLPPYFTRATDEGLEAYHRAILAASRLGAILFHQERTPFSPELTARLAQIDQVVAFKDELGDLVRLAAIQARVGDRLVWIDGMAERLAAPMFAMGARAITSGIANIAPAISLAVYEAVAAGAYAAARRIVAERLAAIDALRERRPGYSVAVVKAAMNLLGRPGGRVRPPLTDLADADLPALRQALERLNI